MHSPSKSHKETIYRVRGYLKVSPGKGLLFSRHNHLKIKSYTNAIWAGLVTDQRSNLGYFTFVEGNLVT
jgi:hypothetical protein